MDVWEHRRRDAAAGEIFDVAMRTPSRSNAPGEVAAYDFGRHDVIADIGGGTGAMLVSAGGKERTEHEWSELFAAGGFRLARIARVSASSHVLVAEPA